LVSRNPADIEKVPGIGGNGIVGESLSSLIGLSGASPGIIGLVPAIEISVLAGAVLAIVFFRFKQPPLLAYIVAGLLLSLFTKPWLGESLAGMEEISHLGLVFLLFIIGLELDLKGIFKLGTKVAASVLLQAPVAIGCVYALQALFALGGYSIAGLAGSPSGWFYFAVATSLSSTAVVVKLLGDKFDLTTEAGRVTVLTLIAQDVWAVLALSLVSKQGGASERGWFGIVVLLAGATVFALFMYFTARFTIARVLAFLATAPDLVALTALGWCFFGTAVMSWVGLSAETGALIAGLAIGSLPGAPEILGKVISLRDFFMAIFFVSLGMSLPTPTLSVIGSALSLVLIVAATRFLFFAPSLLFAGLGSIVSLTVPLNLAQLSEFSLLLVPIGTSTGALTVRDGSIISYAMMLSVLFTTYGIKYNYRFAQFVERLFRMQDRFRRRSSAEVSDATSAVDHHRAEIIMLGYHTNAEALIRRIKSDRPEWLSKILVIDFNLKNHEKIRAHGVAVAYGDISNPETLRHYGIEKASVVLSTTSDTFLRGITNKALVDTIHGLNPKALYIATTLDVEKVDEIIERGAFACVCPPDDASPEYIRHIQAALGKSAG
jgi:Kef-type K+ transport system membrane component KefB